MDRASWEQHYKPRLNLDTVQRYPAWNVARQVWNDPDNPRPRRVVGDSFYGRLRDWMGVEAISYLVYADPLLFEEMVTTMADLIVEAHRRLFEQGAQFDICSMWKDMCYNSGPLLSPSLFKKYLASHYRRFTNQLR